MAEIQETIGPTAATIRLIAIDDDPEWCSLIEITAQSLGYLIDTAQSLEEAKLKIQEAEQKGMAYTVAIIDMNFEMGKKKIEFPRGKEAVQYIKSHHASIACIMVSGSGVTPETVLDLRDDYDLDYYVQKDRFDIDAFGRAIKKAIQRTSAVKTTDRYQKELQKLLQHWRGVYLSTSRNLAIARQREALKGIDVDVGTIHEIEQYQAHMQEAEDQIEAIERKLAQLRDSERFNCSVRET